MSHCVPSSLRVLQPLSRRLDALVFTLALSTQVSAQAPLTVDELLAEPRSLKLELRGAHALQQLIPGDPRAQREHWLLSGGLRYGVTRSTDIYSRLAYAISREPSIPLSAAREHQTGISEFQLGFNQRLVAEGRYPAVLIGGELSFANADDASNRWARRPSSWRAQGIVYRSLDPLVLSMAVSYQAQLARSSDRAAVLPGDALGVTPLVNFAVNHRVSLSGGFLWRWQEGARINGERWLPDSSQIDLLLGLGISPSRDSSLFLQSRFNANRGGSAQLVLDWIRTF